jgi:hypothetical protein
VRGTFPSSTDRIRPTRAPMLHLRTSRRRMVVELMNKALRDNADA